MGTGCSRPEVPPIETTITTPTPSSSRPCSGSPRSVRARAISGPGPRFCSDALEGGARPIPNLDTSLRLLLRTNEGAPAFSTDANRQSITYRIRLNPPPFELQRANGDPIVQLSRDTRRETNTLLVLSGKTKPYTDIWGDNNPIQIYEVRIPASSVLSTSDIDAGISYRGRLMLGSSSKGEGAPSHLHWLIR